MAERRLVWMDAARGAAILLVLLDHATAMLVINGVPIPVELAILADAMSPYRMPLLMYLSGLLLQRSLVKPWQQFAAGKLRNIGWPYVVWSVITLAATTGVSTQALIQIPFVSPTFLWFLWFILAYYVIGWVCNRLGLDPLLVAVLALAASVVLPDFARLSRFSFLLFFFMLGHAAITRSVRFDIPDRTRRLLLLGCLVSVVVCSALAVAGHGVRYSAAYVVGPLALVVLVQTLSGHYRRTRALGAFEYVGRNSLIFYVVHYAVEWLVVETALYLGFSSGRGIFVAAFTIALVAGVATSHSRHRWPPVDWLFAFPTRTPTAGSVRV
ncbi:MAG: acyltransferase family protein [Ornithinimicrobium sp.]